eukprot:354922-Chlamydomonas_euryale.AAC.8
MAACKPHKARNGCMQAPGSMKRLHASPRKHGVTARKYHCTLIGCMQAPGLIQGRQAPRTMQWRRARAKAHPMAACKRARTQD